MHKGDYIRSMPSPKTPPLPFDDLLIIRLRSLSKLLDMDPRTIARWEAEGVMPRRREYGINYKAFLCSEIKEWLEQGRKNVPAPSSAKRLGSVKAEQWRPFAQERDPELEDDELEDLPDGALSE